MRQKRKKKVLLYILVFSLVAVVISGVLLCAVSFMIGEIKAEYEERLEDNNRLIQQNTRLIYVAVRDIRTGEEIREDMLELRRSVCSQAEELLFSQEDIGKLAVADIAAGTFLNKTLASGFRTVKGVREMCYRSITLAGNVHDYDVVDVRIRYPGGEDYVVLSGKRIRLGEEGGGQCFLWVTEEELLLMSAAMVDTEKKDGTYLYTSKYIEPSVQKKSMVTYQPNREVTEIIQESPNIEAYMSDKMTEAF